MVNVQKKYVILVPQFSAIVEERSIKKSIPYCLRVSAFCARRPTLFGELPKGIQPLFSLPINYVEFHFLHLIRK
jgi:hypothetical protein